ncbi:MAG: cell envelope integrity protein TolA [Thermoanaerobaculia bacterium]|nr:cell envelope integrity protein TolA [Thermoanaerobaculia bacterium]
MSESVSDVLEERLRTAEAPLGLMALLSFGSHVALFALLAFMARSKPLPLLPPSIQGFVVSGSSLAQRKAASAPSAAAPRPAAPAPMPLPEAPVAKKPVIEKLTEEQPKPSSKAMPMPGAKAQPEVRPAGRRAPAVEASSQKGSAAALPGPDLDLPSAGNGAGDLQFGASVAGFDSDFPFAYYVEQLQALIGANWIKPQVADGTNCIVYFRILRTGQVTDVKIEQPSGLAHYDRSASRSIFAANPLPPLPPEYQGEYLGVRLRFQ